MNKNQKIIMKGVLYYIFFFVSFVFIVVIKNYDVKTDEGIYTELYNNFWSIIKRNYIFYLIYTVLFVFFEIGKLEVPNQNDVEDLNNN